MIIRRRGHHPVARSVASERERDAIWLGFAEAIAIRAARRPSGTRRLADVDWSKRAVALERRRLRHPRGAVVG